MHYSFRSVVGYCMPKSTNENERRSVFRTLLLLLCNREKRTAKNEKKKVNSREIVVRHFRSAISEKKLECDKREYTLYDGSAAPPLILLVSGRTASFRHVDDVPGADDGLKHRFVLRDPLPRLLVTFLRSNFHRTLLQIFRRSVDLGRFVSIRARRRREADDDRDQ